jgi:hypothetical protein
MPGLADGLADRIAVCAEGIGKAGDRLLEEILQALAPLDDFAARLRQGDPVEAQMRQAVVRDLEPS